MSGKPPLQHPGKGDHIEPFHVFDQTNGNVAVEDLVPDEQDPAARLMAQGFASNTANISFFGGSL